MQYSWDEEKRLSNVQKHGIDFQDAIAIFSGFTLLIEDDRFDYGEQRFIAVGLMDGRVIVLAYTQPKENMIRIISARKGTKHERKAYFQTISH